MAARHALERSNVPAIGINVLILWGPVIQYGFLFQHWLTFRQLQLLRGNIRKGEHGTTVVQWLAIARALPAKACRKLRSIQALATMARAGQLC